MQNIPPPRSPRELLDDAQLRPKKSWGQNFLCDTSVLTTIAQAAQAGPGRTVLELGAGLGALTYHLAASGGRVVAIERDRELVPHLRNYLSFARDFEVREANAATLDYTDLAAQLGLATLTVTGNLPYQLSSRILVNLANAAPVVSRAVVLVQREVGQRLESPPGSTAYGLLSVLVQRAFDVCVVRLVPPSAFFPAPKVHSAVVLLQAHGQQREAARDKHLVAAARAAFSARRKTLRNALKGALRADAEAVEAAIHRAGLSPLVRAETLSLSDFDALGESLQAAGLFDATASAADKAASHSEGL